MKTPQAQPTLKWLKIVAVVIAAFFLLAIYPVFMPAHSGRLRQDQVFINGRSLTIDRRLAETENKPWELVWRKNRKPEDAVLKLVKIYDEIGDHNKELKVFRFLRRHSLNGLPANLLERYEELSEEIGTITDRRDADDAVVAYTQFGYPEDLQKIRRDDSGNVHDNACAARALLTTDPTKGVAMAKEAVRLKPKNALYRCIAGQALANNHLFFESYQQFLCARKLGYLSADAKQQMDLDLIILSAAKTSEPDTRLSGSFTSQDS